MPMRARLEAFQKFTPRHRRIVGGTLMGAWALGALIEPGQYLVALSIPGILIFFSGWPAALYELPD